MAAATTSSSYITNKTAVSSVAAVTYNSIGADGDGRSHVIIGTTELATTRLDDVGDVTLLFALKGNDRLARLILFNDDMDSNGTPTLAINVGLYKDVNAAGTSATAVSASAYASASTTLQSAVTSGTDVTFSARNIDKAGQTVAEDGGESVHSSPRYVGIAVSTAAATAVAGTISWRAEIVCA